MTHHVTTFPCLASVLWEESNFLSVNSLSVIRVILKKPAKRFTAVIGVDRNMDNSLASVRFHVSVDGNDVFATDVVRARAAPRAIEVPLNGAKSFDLTVDVGGDDRNSDQADWADAKVVLEDGSELWLDDIGRQASPVGGLPFSFVYGGKHSFEFIDGWQRELKEEPVGETQLRRTLTLTDPQTGLEVRAVCTVYLDTAGADWMIHFTNKGRLDTPAIEQVRAVDATVDVGLGSNVVMIHRLNGAPCAIDDWMPFDQAVLPGRKVEFAATNGRSSNVSPWFNIDWGTGGVITAIGWSGQWAASVELRDGKLRTQAGMQNLHTILHPGESIRSPRIMQLYWQGGDQYRAYNLFRGTMLAHVVPRIDGKVVEPPIVHMSTSYYELNDSNEQNVLSHLDSIKDLGFEMFWLDAYLPFSAVGQMGATPYLFRSGFNGGIAFGEDVRGQDDPRELLRQGIAEGKRIRKFFHGNFYPLSEANTDRRDWCVLQYHLPDERTGMVLAFRRDQSPDASYDCNLREIDPVAIYQVRMYHGYDPEQPITMSGSDLARLNVTIGQRPGSVIVEHGQQK